MLAAIFTAGSFKLFVLSSIGLAALAGTIVVVCSRRKCNG
jgi:hypothetical protein